MPEGVLNMPNGLPYLSCLYLSYILVLSLSLKLSWDQRTLWPMKGVQKFKCLL